MIPNKKGYEFGLNNVIMGVLFILVIIASALKVNTALASESDIQRCRASVDAKSIAIKFGSFGTNAIDPIDLNLDCHTANLIVNKDNVVNLKEGRTVAKFDEGRFDGRKYEDKLKTVIADSMENCWKMFGKGEIDPFTRLDGDKHCVQCYDITFNDKAKKELQDTQNKQTLDDFNRFLVENMGSNKETYAKFLFNVEGQDEADKFSKGSPPLDINKQYAVIFYSARGIDSNDAAAKAMGILKVAEIVGCPSHGLAELQPIKSFLGPFRKVVDVVDFVSPACLGAKVVGFAIQVPGDALIHQVGIAYMPIEKMSDACRRLD